MSVLGHVEELLPRHHLLYFGDQAHAPYGDKPASFVDRRSHAITEWLIDEGANPIVLACNSASAVALEGLRSKYADTAFVGMEPAVKPAVTVTSSRIIGVLGTDATLDGALFARTVERFGADAEVLAATCPGLSQLVDAGEATGQEAETILRQALEPMCDKGMDTVVLGCSHYPLVTPLIRRIVGTDVAIIDPAPDVARQVRRVVGALGLVPEETARKRFVTSGDARQMADALASFYGSVEVDHVHL